ncbi:hypothetical protein EGT74_16735 [Chitinophaga lutea]|uniref:Uncharacterized protein n=1 Tax=Chitinophaga lutea TaxID=2488634 RepID=A0A3N4PJ28_9BACT|nr:hypothetical protein [Chitinophaga lutea]RPE08683.1 hypothetical protein EGT74_16735 [Chitinophaga lutea]
MAILTGPLAFTGKIGDISAYQIKGTNKVVIRKKGGVSGKRIKTAPEYERTRQNNSEFKGCTMLTAAIRDAVYPVTHLGDGGFTGHLNAFAKKLQLLCDTNNRGQRNIHLSRHRHMLAGFNFNGEHLFDQVVRNPVTMELQRDTSSARITIPRLTPGLNLRLPWEQPHYRFIVSLGLAGDVQYTGQAYKLLCESCAEYTETPWEHVDNDSPETAIDLQLNEPITPTANLLLCVAIEMGTPDRFGKIVAVKKTGAAKIVAVF